MEKALIYLPYSYFIDSYEHKALGAIPIGFKEAGFDTSLIVGAMKSVKFRETGIRIYETGNRDDRYIINGKPFAMHMIPRLMNALNLGEYKKALNIIKMEKPNIIMAYNNSTLTWLIFWRYKLYCKFNKIKTTKILKLDNDGTDLIGMKGIRKLALELYYKLLSHIFDGIITETSCGYKVFSGLPGVKPKLRIVPNTVFDDFLENNDTTGRDKTIISVSRITPVKGIELLIKSFKLLADRYPDWNLEIIGPITNRAYYSHLVDMVNSSGLEKRVIFTGEKNRKELMEIYKHASVYCLFSEFESFAISRLEAVSMGLYVVTSDAGCASDFVKYGVHVMRENTPECGSRYIEDGIRAIESGAFSGNHIRIPSYREIAMQIAALSENNGMLQP
jgi:glycosyltransferase involved in cell wall biosynthesis